MIEVASAPSTIDSPAAADMSSAEEWPSLEAAVADTTNPVSPTANNNSSSGVGDDWEMLSPTSTDHSINNNNNTGDGENVVVVPHKHPLTITRQGSISAPDLSILGGGVEEEDSSAVMVPNNGESVASSSVVVVPSPQAAANSNPWLNKNKVSFRDAILTPSKYVPANKLSKNNAAPQRVRNKVKSRYVVAPIKRCAKSTGDLLSLAGQEEEIMGESDAIEYYNRKSHGEHGRNNGLKQRPDEAKRKDMIVQKKNMQRQKQGK